MTLKEAYNYSVYFLAGNGIDEAEFKSLCLVCHLADIKNSEYQQHINDDVMMKKLADLLWRVKSGEPLQYVIGKWDFFESEFFVGNGVLIPRPETEELCALAIEKAKNIDNPVIFDLCSGSGCIGISIAKKLPNSTVYLFEKSNEAFYYLLKNADGISNVRPILCDIADYDCKDIRADIIVSNPPYIKSEVLPTLDDVVQKEPIMALDGGYDGLDFYRIIKEKWQSKLNSNGVLLLEIGEEQGEDIKNLFAHNDVQVIKDIYNNDRMVSII